MGPAGSAFPSRAPPVVVDGDVRGGAAGLRLCGVPPAYLRRCAGRCLPRGLCRTSDGLWCSTGELPALMALVTAGLRWALLLARVHASLAALTKLEERAGKLSCGTH